MQPAFFERNYFQRAYKKGYASHNPPRKLDHYLARIREAKPSGTLLDVGCACGLFLAHARRFYEVTACELSDHAVRVARERLPDVEILRADVGDLPSERRFDVVTAFDVLEHFPDPPGAIVALCRRLRDGGVMALAVPVFDGLPGRLVRLLDRDDTHLRKESRSYWRDAMRHGGLDIVFSVHPNPNVRTPVTRHLSGLANVRLLDPLDYESFVYLMMRSRVILTDSGGIQEEAPALGIPVLVMRNATERPEAVRAGCARLVGTDPRAIARGVEDALAGRFRRRRSALRRYLFGDGHASERIVRALGTWMAR